MMACADGGYWVLDRKNTSHFEIGTVRGRPEFRLLPSMLSQKEVVGEKPSRTF